MKQIKRILLVEDNVKDVAIVKTILSQKGREFDIEVAVTGEQALEMMKTSLPDLVLLDYNLPGINGLIVLEQIHRNEWQLPVIILTGVGDELIAAEAIKNGAADYIVKDDKMFSTLVPLIKNLQSSDAHTYKSSLSFLPSQINLLLIEDNIRDAEIVKKYFEKNSPHIHIQWISNSSETMKTLKSGVPIDCILIDLMLLQTNAVQLIKEVEAAGIRLPFVVITGSGSEEWAVAAMKQGAYDYISKRDNYTMKLPYVIEMAILKFRKDTMTYKLQRDIVELNASLEQKVKERTAALESEIAERKKIEEKNRVQLNELLRWQEVMLGREDRNRDLKKEVNELLIRLGEPIRYPSMESNDAKDKSKLKKNE